MALSIITKQPGELIRVPVLVSFAAVEPVEIRSTARGLVPGAAQIAAAYASGTGEAILSGGADGERYLVKVRATDVDGTVREVEIEVAVIEGRWAMPDGGVGYLSIVEFVKMFGLEEVIRMTDDASGRIDRDMLIGALQAAQGIADGNVATLYAVPIATVPDLIKTAIADIARARLYPRGAPEGVATNAKEGLRTLERIASGALKLALPTGAPAAPAVSEAPVLISPGRRAYPDGRGASW